MRVSRNVKKPPSSTLASATAAIGTGRTGTRGVATGTSAMRTPWRWAIIAAIWRWQFRPWHRPMPARVRLLTTFESPVAAIASPTSRALTSSQRHTTVSGVGELVDACTDGVQRRERPAERLLTAQPRAERRRASAPPHRR